jgi:hypothetical protein
VSISRRLKRTRVPSGEKQGQMSSAPEVRKVGAGGGLVGGSLRAVKIGMTSRSHRNENAD